MSRSLLAQTLDDAFAFASAIMTVQALAKDGRQADALDLIGQVSVIAADRMPVIQGVVAAVDRAQRDAAEIMNLPQRTRVLCSIGVAQPHPHTPNDHHQAPSEPDDIIA